jgi:hypothetical protein
LADREYACRHLVEERLEEVVVRPVDQRDVDVALAQEPRGEQAAETAADDHDAVGHRAAAAIAVDLAKASRSAFSCSLCVSVMPCGPPW